MYFSGFLSKLLEFDSMDNFNRKSDVRQSLIDTVRCQRGFSLKMVAFSPWQSQ